jgi:hypothetical protein
MVQCEAIHEPPDWQQESVMITPRPLHFGWQAIGTESIERKVEVRNVGTAAETVHAISLPRPFLLRSAPRTPFMLEPQAAVTLVIAFTPDADECFEGQIDLAMDSSRSSMLLAGAGSCETKIWNTDPNPIDFGDQKVGTSSSRDVLFWNGGTEGGWWITGMGLVGGPVDRPPPFAVSGFRGRVEMRVRYSFAVQATFSPTVDGIAGQDLWVEIETEHVQGIAAVPLMGRGTP